MMRAGGRRDERGRAGPVVCGGRTLAAPPCPGSLDALRAGHFALADPLPGWRDLLVAWHASDRPRPAPAQQRHAALPWLRRFDKPQLASRYRPAIYAAQSP